MRFSAIYEEIPTAFAAQNFAAASPKRELDCRGRACGPQEKGRQDHFRRPVGAS
jgi:hypothetical protein